jgi:hypothetical protein
MRSSLRIPAVNLLPGIFAAALLAAPARADVVIDWNAMAETRLSPPGSVTGW